MKQRTALWDSIKFFLITAVVVGHLTDWFTEQSGFARSVFLFIYSFHMPMFFFISGLFHNNRNISRKCLFYISAGFALKLLNGQFSALTGGSFYFSLLSDGGIPWFMFALAAFSALAYWLRSFNKWYLLGVSVVLSCMAGYDASLGDYLYLSRIVVFFPFYLLGVILDSDQILSFKAQHPRLIFPAILTVIGVGLLCVFQLDRIYMFRYLLTGRNPYFNEILSYAPLARLCCYLVATAMGAAIIWIIPSRKIPWITRMGTHSVDVYFWHFIVYELLEKAVHFSRLYSYGFPGKIAFLLVGVAISILLSQGGIFSFPLKQLKACCNSRRAALCPEQTK